MLRAFLISPLAVFPALLVAVFVAFIVEAIKISGIPSNALSEFTAAFIYAAVAPLVSYPITLLYGLPVYLLLKKLNKYNLYSLAALAILPAVVIGIAEADVFVFLGIAYFSLCIAISFWWLSKR